MEPASIRADERPAGSAGKDFARRFTNMLCELRLQPGIQNRIDKLLGEFADEHFLNRLTVGFPDRLRRKQFRFN